MQQQTIQFDGAQIQQRVDVRAMFANAVNSVNNYLNQRSEVWKSHTNLTHPVKVF